MLRFVMSSPVGSVTSKLLRDALQEVQGSRVRYSCRKGLSRRAHGQPGLRWGSVTPMPNTVNSEEAVRLASNKMQSLKKMNEAGVSSAQPFPREMFSELPQVPLIFRKNYRHAGNDNPYIVQENEAVDQERARQYDYAIEFIPSWAEYRVHVVKGGVVRVQRKRKINGWGQHDPNIRSSTRGWALVEEDEERFNSAEFVDPAVQAVAALGLDFGGVDVLRAKHGRKSVVIEVNTAPGLNADGVSRYVKALLTE